jgi:NAD dependent epimerase/dehydratase family enzyme
VQLPLLLKQGLDSGTVRTVGPGRNVYSNVHIEDMVDAYELALEQAGRSFLFRGER